MKCPGMIARPRGWAAAAALCAVALATGTAAAQQGDTIVATRQAVSRAWFGFSIACSDCTMMSTSAGIRWTFNDSPQVVEVEPGSPAEQAGLRVGDVLAGIDGMPLASDSGAERFASVRAGQTVRFDVRRGGRTMAIALRARQYAASVRAAKAFALATADPAQLPLAKRDTLATKLLAFTVTRAPTPSVGEAQDTVRTIGIAQRKVQAPLRFSGSFGNSDITVRGPAGTTVTIADRECWMEIRGADTVVRLQLRDGCGKEAPRR